MSGTHTPQRVPLTMQHGVPKTPPQERIPIHLVQKLIERWLVEYRSTHAANGGDSAREGRYVEGKENNEGVLNVLSFHTGVSGRSLRRIRSGGWEIGNKRSGTFALADWVPFDIADKIVCGTVGPLAWHTEPLNEFYGPLTVRRSEAMYERAAA